MSLTTGTVGLSSVGKSTLFNAITKVGAEMASYSLATTEPDVGMVEVPDSRLAHIQELIPTEKIVHTTFGLTDIAGLVKDTSKDEGLENKFPENIRQTDAIVHVVRAFDDDNIASVTDRVDPEGDINTISLELVIADLDAVNRRTGKVQKVAQQGDKGAKAGMAVLSKLKPVLEGGKTTRSIDFNEDEQKIVKGLFSLTSKPVIYVANTAESSMADPEGDEYYQVVKKHTKSENTEVLGIGAATEEEIVSMDKDEREEFLEMEGAEESGLDHLIKAAYHILGLRIFFAAGGPETRAWTFHGGTKAPQVAGVIHSDFGRGFIRVEVVSFDDLDKLGTMQKVREAGKLHLEGRGYVIQDGDIIEFRLNV